MGAIKGAAVREFIHWCYSEFGADFMAAAIVRVPASVRSQLVVQDPWLGMLASRWYDARVVHAVLGALTADLDEERRSSMAQQASQAVMDRTLKGIYKVLFQWMATPDRYCRYASKLWSAYYDCGDFSVVMDGESTAICTIREWDSHHPVICDLNRGAAAAIYTAMGCHGVNTVREACVSRGGEECRFVTSWAADDIACP